MWIPIVHSMIDRKILVNYRVDPEVLRRILPPRFQPRLINGVGIAGICLFRLKRLQSQLLPRSLNIVSENVCHQVAVRWQQDGRCCEGIFVTRRDTSSWLNTLAGGKLFSEVHHHARFRVREGDERYFIEMTSDDRQVRVVVEGYASFEFSPTSIFRSPREAFEFLEGHESAFRAVRASGANADRELQWKATPLNVERVVSSYFENRRLFPPGSVAFDSAVLMRAVEPEWRKEPVLCPESIA